MSIPEEYRPAGFFALRTPLLPFAAWTEWSDGLCTAEAVEASVDIDLRAALDRDLDCLRSRLRLWMNDPVILEAFFVASPSLELNVRHWLADPTSDRGRRVGRSIVKYFARMAGRSTPFGLFSGCATGNVGTSTGLHLAPRSAYKRHTRPDMDFLAALVDGLNRDPELRSELRFRPNSSLYRFADRVQYAEARLRGRDRSYFLVSASADEAMTAVLARAAAGATLDDLTSAIAAIMPEVGMDEARGYLNELVDAQVIVPELAPAVTGPESLDDLILQLESKPRAAATREKLVQLRAALHDMDEHGLGVAPARYREIAESLRGLPADADIARLFQVDLTKPGDGLEIDDGIVRDLLEGVEILYRLFGTGNADGLEDFRKEFRERYEEREVPLVEAMDEEVGIGFRASSAPGSETSPLLEGIQFPMRLREQTLPLNGTTGLLHRKLFETYRAGSSEMVLEQDDLAPIGTSGRKPLPDAFQIMASLLPPSASDGGTAPRRLLFMGMSGPSGARLLGRFCHADEALRAHVERHLADEEALRPDATFFEVVHLPEGRIGNVIARPVLRQHELPFLGRSNAAADRQIPITDLVVSLQGDRIVLRSRALQRELIPRLTTAHNTELRTVGIYRFLAALQIQSSVSGLNWNWGTLSQLPFLPRVRCGNVILSRCTWNVTEKEIKGFSSGSDLEQFRKIQEWGSVRGLPRHVGLVDGDNVLPVDLRNPASIDAFVDEVAERSQITLREMLPGPHELCVSGPEGRYCHELLVPFVRKQVESKTATSSPGAPEMHAPAQPDAPHIPRLRHPGSDWLYLKMYCGDATADRLLREIVSPLVAQMSDGGWIDRWFFVRFADPSTHLRVRLHGDPRALLERVLPAAEGALRSFLDNGLVWKLQIDSYDREIRRYGGPLGIELCESIFHADSDAACAILVDLVGDDGASDRWRATLAGIDRLLDDFGIDLRRKFSLMQIWATAHAQEAGIAGTSMESVLAKYRKERKSLELVLDRSTTNGAGRVPYAVALDRRSVRVRTLAAELQELARANRLQTPMDTILQSVVHMHANRMLRGSTRAQETILYQFLDRHYDSQLARQGIKGKMREEIHASV